MSKRLYKCYGYCESKYPKEELLKFKANPNSKTEGVNVCRSCFDIKTKEVNDRNSLYKFIQETYNLTFPTGNMLRQIKTFKEERGYTYKNIWFTLDYVFNVKKVYKPQTKFGVAMVPYFHDEMIAYYKNLKERRENTEVKKIESKKITIKPFELNHEYRTKKIINMEEILND